MAKKRQAAKQEAKSKKSSKTASKIRTPQAEAKAKPHAFPVVGIGASAGGLKALEDLFSKMDPKSGMAFVIVQHMDPSRKSLLSELLQKHTSMKVSEVEDGMRIAPDCIYTIPPNKEMAIFKGTLQLLEPSADRIKRKPIDYFFRSLANDQKENAIGIVLSGTGTEGTLGLKSIRGSGGLALVQEPESADYDGMPRSAIQSNVFDFILTPEKMAKQLVEYPKRKGFEAHKKEHKRAPEQNLLEKTFMTLRAKTGNDFSQYKQNTITRRIEKRMAVNQINQLSDYVKFLQKSPEEVEALFKSMTIGVTNFFRDPEAFKQLENSIVPRLLQEKEALDQLRIWVPGCSTGEEAYSIAMILQECLDDYHSSIKVSIFATDLDLEAIETARLGIYPESINVDVSSERLERFFTKIDHHYKVDQSIRNMVIFAEQNVISDPPFSKLDLISCRNLLIYLSSDLQKKVLPLFHYSLLPSGMLFLGGSETIGEFGDLFETVDRKWKIFKKKGIAAAPLRLNFNLHSKSVDPVGQPDFGTEKLKRTGLREIVQGEIMETFTPAAVVINDHDEAVYFFGNTGKYLQPASGNASLNVVDMARKGLKLELGAAIRKARKHNELFTTHDVSVQTNGVRQIIDLVVKPLKKNNNTKGLLLIVFKDVPESKVKEIEEKSTPQSQARVEELESELASTKEYLQTTIEELETTNEELKSANEEMLSSNEELQSTNEELETSKEELQSLNEEMITMNSELQNKIDELSNSNDDLTNLMSSTQIGVLFLDSQLKIKRFTDSITDVISIMQTDIGRPLKHFSSSLQYDDMIRDAEQVLKTLETIEKEVRSINGRWFKLRIMPYRTKENVIDGLVLTLIDSTHEKRYRESLKQLNEHLNLVVDALPGIPYRATVKPNHKLIFIGKNVKHLTGYEPKEITSDPNFWVSHLHPEDKVETLEQLTEVNEHNFRWKCADGKYKQFHNIIRKVRVNEKEPEILVGIWQDISGNDT